LNNNKPTTRFNRNVLLSDYFLTPDILAGFYVFSVFQHISQIFDGNFPINFNYSIGNSNSAKTDRAMHFLTGGGINNPTEYSIGAQGNTAVITTPFAGGRKLISNLIKSESTNFYINNSLIGENTNVMPSFTNTPFRVCLGREEWLSANVPSNIDLQEFIIYNSDQSANRIGIETNINTEYTIY
jgi:hypothetical protein